MGQYTISSGDRADASAFDVPGDEPGTDDSYPLDRQDNTPSKRAYVHINNGFDVNVDVTLRGSHYLDSTMSNAADDGSTVTISNGAVDFFDVSTGHSFIEINVDPANTPTSGDLVVTFQVRDR